ncbi:MAG: HEPN domain-containing protein [Candidatus Altiarchaeota archaeon]|nr:HEPN domain-containing protein [Candidatus Altiarchaeota archaeon]
MNQKTINEIGDKAASYWKNLAGIIVFGSCVKENRYNDIDLLIVLDEIDKNRIERLDEIMGFKRTLETKKPVDITLVSKEECLNNFRNHNPLYLDITLDGKIVYDTGTLQSLIDETQEYLTDKHIVREKTRWLFPTKKGVSLLSKISNKDWAESWLKDAKRDLRSAQALHKEGLFEKTVYHSQQCIEKSVKAILICFGAFEKTHYVSTVLKEETSKKKLNNKNIEEVIRIAENMEPHMSLSRYPGISHDEIWLPYEEYDHEIAVESLNSGKKVMKIAKKFIEDWFKNEIR